MPETNPIDPGYYSATEPFEIMSLYELYHLHGIVTRVRWLGEYRPGYGMLWDLSYVHGELPNGTRVIITHAAFLLRSDERMKHLIEWARESNVYAKKIGLLDKSNWSEMW